MPLASGQIGPLLVTPVEYVLVFLLSLSIRVPVGYCHCASLHDVLASIVCRAVLVSFPCILLSVPRCQALS
jgi:hypothetical protein